MSDLVITSDKWIENNIVFKGDYDSVQLKLLLEESENNLRKSKDELERSSRRNKGPRVKKFKNWQKTVNRLEELLENVLENEKEGFLTLKPIDKIYKLLRNSVGVDDAIELDNKKFLFIVGPDGLNVAISEGGDGLVDIDDWKGDKGFKSFVEFIFSVEGVSDVFNDASGIAFLEKVGDTDKYTLRVMSEKIFKDKNISLPSENIIWSFIPEDVDPVAVLPEGSTPEDPFNVLKNTFKDLLTKPSEVKDEDVKNLNTDYPEVVDILDKDLDKKLATGQLSEEDYKIAKEKIKNAKFSRGVVNPKFIHVKYPKRNKYVSQKGLSY